MTATVAAAVLGGKDFSSDERPAELLLKTAASTLHFPLLVFV
jgi:hypothetical protein